MDQLLEYRDGRPFIAVRTKFIDDVAKEWIERVQSLQGGGGGRSAREQGAVIYPHASEEKKRATAGSTHSIDSSTDDADVQVVLIGGGLDTRAYRLECFKNVCVYEIDQQNVVDRKNALLAQHTPCCKKLARIVGDVGERKGKNTRKVVVNIDRIGHSDRGTRGGDDGTGDALSPYHGVDNDLRERTGMSTSAVSSDGHPETVGCPSAAVKTPGVSNPNSRDWIDRLMASGFSPRSPTLWIVEGLVMYLSSGQVEELLNVLSAFSLCPSSTFVADLCTKNAKTSGLSYYNLFQWGLDFSAVKPYFASTGWHCEQLHIMGKTETEVEFSRDGNEDYSMEAHGRLSFVNYDRFR